MPELRRKSSRFARPRRRLLSLLIAHALALPAGTHAATIVVNNPSDDGTGCTLREAIDSMNDAALSPGCTNSGAAFGTDNAIEFGPSVAGQTITLTGGALFVQSSVAINALGTEITTIDANQASQGFFVSSPITVTMNRLAVNNGRPGTIAVSGGGIYVAGGASLVVENCSFMNNQASTAAAGGAIALYRAGSLTVTNSTFTGNSGFDQGGGISVRQSGNVTINGSTFQSNVAVAAGAVAVTGSVNQVDISDSVFSSNSSQGAPSTISFENNSSAILSNSVVTGNSGAGAAVYGFLADSLQIIDSTISDNAGGLGGGVYARFSPLTISGSTISGNSATSHGAGVTAKASGQAPYSADIENTTISGNFTVAPTGDFPSALYLGRLDSASLKNVTVTGNDIQGAGSAAVQLYRVNTAVVSNTIAANTPDAPDCTTALSDSVTIGGDSIIEDNLCGGTPLNLDPLLLPLGDNGGPTLTHALDPASPAIDAGDNPTCSTLDQRGFPRPADGNGDLSAVCDVGAVEAGAGNQPPVAADDTATTRQNIPVTIDVAANDFDSDGNLDISTTNASCGTCSAPVHGTLTNNSDGTFGFSPDLDFIGSDFFVYEICDTDGACDTAGVDITVDPPSADVRVSILRCVDRTAPLALYRYGLRIVNDGPDSSEGVALVHSPIAGATVIGTSSSSCVDTGTTVDCDLETLVPGAEVEIGLEIAAPDVGAQTLSMSAEVAASTDDPSLQDNLDVVTVEIVPTLVVVDDFESCGEAP